MEILMIAVFVLGYLAIAFEHPLRLNKAASALLTGVLCWTVYILYTPDYHAVVHHLESGLGNIAGILFFLLGAMVVVELMDAYDGFELVTERIRTRSKRRLLWTIGLITFFLSAILDNLTTAIVMVSLIRKIISDREDRLLFAGLIVIAANAGGAWSPMGDVTTTMLWIKGQISAINIIKMLIVPSLVCLLVPMLVLHVQMKGEIARPPLPDADDRPRCTPRERNTVFFAGLGVLLSVPIFKTVTHLPPFMGMLLGLGVMWLITEIIHGGLDEADKGTRSVAHALRKVDTPSILFFLGILIAISALESNGMLEGLAHWLDKTVGNLTLTGVIIGFMSAIVDNVPLVAAAQGMYSLEQYPQDHYFWELLAYCAGTGGSVLIIGSAAGVAAMGIERIDFIWYLKKVSWLAALGYLAGVLVFVLMSM
ncbi:MAG: sodium:proton antiporter NhaD [Chitinophagales bacterium]|nr:sodium:proton antiporter NhaD [Chitinophagales bacterium]